jgi:hypothetical protein
MEKNYEKLYRKYKKKYLNLSKIIKNKGGSSVSDMEMDVEVDTYYKIRRPYNGEKILILGCGNGPNNLDQKYKLEHMHPGAYTIDIQENMNPSCLTDMKNGIFCQIPDNSIEQIICEGFSMDILSSKNFIDEINRIKKYGGICNCEFRNIGSFRNFNGDWDNIYNEPPFLTFDEALNFVPGNKKNFELDENGNMMLYIKDNMGNFSNVDYLRLKFR